MKKIIANPAFQKRLQEIAKQEERPLEVVQQEAAEYITELYSEQKPLAQTIGYEVLQYILSRGYEKKIDVDPKEIRNLRKLMRRHSIAFVNTHKTYLDMMALLIVLVRYGMPMPFVFSGINMGFAGVKQLGKAGGAIFIRRDIKDNTVYKASLRHYIASQINSGKHFQWAIEGTRSRTGKIVWPKMGILKYIADGEQASNKEVKYIPVSIVCDLIPDVKEMTLEGKGKSKKPEDLAWFLKYIMQLDDNFGRIAIRFGDPVEMKGEHTAVVPGIEENSSSDKNLLPRFAFELVHNINQITPVTTVSLVCNVLLSNFALSKKEIESQVTQLMFFIEQRKQDILLDRGKPIGKSVQTALNLLIRANIVHKTQSSLHAKYLVSENEYLQANYYSNMAANHLYQRAFIELALVKIFKRKSKNRLLDFWIEIMTLRDLFKFEFFYSNKAEFSDEIEAELALFDANWRDIISNPKGDIQQLLSQQHLSVAEPILLTYIEAYKVVLQSLLNWDKKNDFTDKDFIAACLFTGKEMHWQGQIRRGDSVSKPFLTNGLRLARNRQLTPEFPRGKKAKIETSLSQLKDLTGRLEILQNLIVKPNKDKVIDVPIQMEVVPGSDIETLANTILQKEEGPHIAAFFDLDRTLINDFSAKQFVQARLLSGKVTAKEVFAQIAGLAVYVSGNKNFASMAALSAKGADGLPESTFIDLGEQVYMEHLAKAIYPESRALVASHFAKGHTVVIVSAATPYQVNPVARDLGIEHVMCTRLEVENGKFTGNIVEPACWGEGKAIAGRTFSAKHDIDLSKSYFYTDSAEDLPLMEIVGHPQAVNPDKKLSQVAFENNWPIHRFEALKNVPIINSMRTGLAVGSLYPAVMKGVFSGATSMSWQEGLNSMIASVGDLGTQLAGIDVAVRGKEHLDVRPTVFCFNHQSSVDFFILCKLLRRDVTAVAKKELQYSPVGPIFQAANVIFIDRKDRSKAIEALKPAVEALKNGTSVAIAPEGTRSKDRRLGKFKKGAFHLAMQAGVPITPIIIKNAHDALPKGSNLMRPAHIEVVVLEPIDVSAWDPKNMDKHVEDVRNMYLKVLEQEVGS